MTQITVAVVVAWKFVGCVALRKSDAPVVSAAATAASMAAACWSVQFSASLVT